MIGLVRCTLGKENCSYTGKLKYKICMVATSIIMVSLSGCAGAVSRAGEVSLASSFCDLDGSVVGLFEKINTSCRKVNYEGSHPFSRLERTIIGEEYLVTYGRSNGDHSESVFEVYNSQNRLIRLGYSLDLKHGDFERPYTISDFKHIANKHHWVKASENYRPADDGGVVATISYKRDGVEMVFGTTEPPPNPAMIVGTEAQISPPVNASGGGLGGVRVEYLNFNFYIR